MHSPSTSAAIGLEPQELLVTSSLLVFREEQQKYAHCSVLCSVSASSTKEHQHQGATIPALYHLEVKTGAVLLKRWC